MVASKVPVIEVGGNAKVTETFISKGCGECVIDPAGATPQQLAAAGPSRFRNVGSRESLAIRGRGSLTCPAVTVAVE